MLRPYEQRFPWNLDWNLLRTFMVIVEQRSVTRAANFLGLKQPTISSALRRLEEAVGHQLVIRKPNEFLVTPSGKMLYDQCLSVFGTVAKLPSILNAEEEALNGHINLTLASHVVSPHFDTVLHDFGARHPRVTFSISIAESAEVVNRVRQSRASLGICLIDRRPAGLDLELLFRESFGLFCGPAHRLFGRRDIRLVDLEGEPSVSFQTETEGGPLDAVARLRARAHLAPGPRGISSNLTEVRRMIVSGLGIGALPLHVAKRDVEEGRLWQIAPYSNLPSIDIYLVTNPKRQATAPETEFLSLCREMISRTPIEERTYL
ncbi:LysR family transcriptional regulator [Thetidibacter halocola]|uniref:LysR family transcriptional regulator n=1 Tax=Thetidibacter halocola TaxID=2827239 RepID=A0A8J8B7X9_9RHOB|nr:LysR family transcriptional regulator [Thetidibacter halocola]MBS0122613.1 LysR family transcriptional regulator [Thetidibacter halocola]